MAIYKFGLLTLSNFAAVAIIPPFLAALFFSGSLSGTRRIENVLPRDLALSIVIIGMVRRVGVLNAQNTHLPLPRTGKDIITVR